MLVTGEAFISANAAVLFNEDFDYEDGALTSVSEGAWNFNANGGGSQGQLQVVGGSAVATYSRGEDAYRALDTAYSSGVLYYSALFTVTELPNSYGGYFFNFSDTDSGTDTDYFARLFIVVTGEQYQLGIKNRSTYPTDYSPLYNETPLDLNVQVAVVVKFDFSTLQATLWINPTDENSASITDSTAVAFSGADQALSRFQIREVAGIGTSVIETIRVGTTFEDVLLVAVPEPSPMGLAGSVVAVGFLYFGWRQSVRGLCKKIA